MSPLIHILLWQVSNCSISVIRALSDRVEKEHSQYLRDSQRNEDRSAIMDPSGASLPQFSGEVDFQSLVSGGAKNSTGSTLGDIFASNEAGASLGVNNGNASGHAKVTSWEDDVWGSILNGAEVDFEPRKIGVSNSFYSLPGPRLQCQLHVHLYLC